MGVLRVGLILAHLRARAAEIERAGGNGYRADQGEQQHRRDGHRRTHAIAGRARTLDEVCDAPGSRWWWRAPDDAQRGIGVGAGSFGDGCGDTWRGGLRGSAKPGLARFLAFSLPLDARLVGGDGGEDGGAEGGGRLNRGEIADLLADATEGRLDLAAVGAGGKMGAERGEVLGGPVVAAGGAERLAR